MTDSLIPVMAFPPERPYNLYSVVRKKIVYDDYGSAIIAAMSEEEAILIWKEQVLRSFESDVRIKLLGQFTPTDKFKNIRVLDKTWVEG